ncbi:Dynactin p62 [Lasallia pustulata]|uniref:Dynactin subunit 4 n=1 Tax=Lasallia pustulata TaxID=136370 RepID=A0A1W5CXH9_9LECA|nr:Dynactin p62 [Lasallia pustulata]
MVKSEGNRCTRNCCNCPICTAPLAVSTLESEPGGAQSQWILTCGYCNWTSLDIDIRFDKPNNVYSQLAKIKSEHTTAKGADPSNHPQATDPDARFATLKSFYTTQLSSFPPTNPLLSSPSDYNYSSPSSLARIMSLYTSLHSSKPPTSKPLPMREALTRLEGLHLHSRTSSASTLQILLTHGWDHTTSPAQRSSQAPPPPRFLSSLRPVPALLRTKRSKRCRTCRHILVKPEAKVQSTRYRIRLVAVNYLPRITLKPLPASAATASTTTTTTPPPPSLDLAALPPLHPLQLVLTLTNPMYDAVKITLATPRRTPGLPGHKVTVLCPQFEVGASADVWDEALGAEAKRDARSKGADVEGEGKGREAEAGKVWERGRNWTSVVLEVVFSSTRFVYAPFTEQYESCIV